MELNMTLEADRPVSRGRGGVKEPMHRRDSAKGRVVAPSTLRERLIARRQELGLSQDEVASQIVFWNNKQKMSKTLSRSAYCMYESGEVVPDIEKIVSLSKVFHCTPQWLAFGSTDSKPKDRTEEVDYDPAIANFVVRDFWELNPSWISSRFECYPNEIVLVMINDFSPSLKPGDLAFVRKGVEPSIGGGEFVFVQDDTLKAAYVAASSGGGGYHIYDASRSARTDVGPEALRFLGKVVGKMGDI